MPKKESIEELHFERDRTALILVDLQPDFLPGGALAVPDGDAVLEPIRKLMARDLFGVVVATQDWHPQVHVSFASSHSGRKPMETIMLHGHRQTLWPDHCIQGTAGAKLAEGLPWEQVMAIIRKGESRDSDSYSGFRNNWSPAGDRPVTGLAGYLREREVTDVVLCGLARDFCVKWSAEDAAEAGFRTAVLWNLTRPVDPESDARVREEITAAGVTIA